MAFAVMPWHAASLPVARRPVGLGSGFQCRPCAAVPAFRTNAGLRAGPGVRCSSAEGVEAESLERGERKDAALETSLSQSESVSFADKYGGWTPVELESEVNWKAGRRLTLTAPTPTQTRQTSAAKTSTNDEPDYFDDDVTFDDLAIKDKEQDSEEALKETSQADTDQDVQKESQPDVDNKDEQGTSEEAKQTVPHGSKQETQRPASEPVGKTTSTGRNRKKTSASQGRAGKVVVPAIVDRMQEQALAALQSLKVVEEGVDPGAICTRRDYARWLIATSSTLTRSSANKVFPAMYIEDETDLAFDDVTPDDPDFPYIQGLAEAGLIPSNLSHMDVSFGNWTPENDFDGVIFRPDSPVSRQDLVSWKVALDRRSLSAIDKEAFQAQSGFIDVDRIESSVWPALISDLYSGDSSIIASAFGFTRRFQPQKAVTNGQAAIALASGDSSGQFAEELARLEAENLAEEAVTADAAMEARAHKELNALYNGQLETERQRREHAEKLLQEVQAELEKVKLERKAEKDSLLKDRVNVEAEKELMLDLKQELDEQLQELATYRVEASIERERLEKLRSDAEEDQEAVFRLKSEVDVEKKALVLARFWAEDEAQKTRAQAKVLEEARKRWAGRGSQVTADKAFDEDSIPGPSWRYSGGKTELGKVLHRAPLQDVMDKGQDLKYKLTDALVRFWHAIERVLSGLLHRIVAFLQAAGRKTHQLQHDTFSSAGHRLQDTVSVVGQRFEAVQAAVAGFSSSALDGTKRFADGCRGEAGKLAHRFKHD